MSLSPVSEMIHWRFHSHCVKREQRTREHTERENVGKVRLYLPCV